MKYEVTRFFNEVSIMCGIIGAAIAPFFGGWDKSLKALLLCFLIDYLSGMAAAKRFNEFSSKRGLKGIIRKSAMMLAVIFANTIDDLISPSVPLCREAVIFACIGNEGISIIENLGRCGVPIPDTMTKAIEQLKNKENEHGKEDTN